MRLDSAAGGRQHAAMASAVRGRALAIVVMAQLASGCCFSFTRAVWGDEEVSKPRAVVWVERETSLDLQVGLAPVAGADESSGEVALVAWTDQGTDRDGGSTWMLQNREGGEVLVSLLGSAPLATEVALAIDVVSDHEHGDPAWARAAIEVRGRVALGGLGVLVDREALAEPTRQALAAVEVASRNAFAEAAADGSFAAQSTRLASQIDPRLLAAAGPGWVVFGALLLDSDGRPWSTRAEEASWSPGRERAALASARVALLATNGTESSVWLVPAGLAVLGGQLRVDADGAFVHRSMWSFAAIPPRKDLESLGGAGLTWPMRLVERDLVHGLQKDDRSFATKLALTPPALLVDLAVGWLFQLIGLPFCDCDDDDDGASGRR